MKKITALFLAFIILCSGNVLAENYEGNGNFYDTVRKISFTDMAFKPVDHWSNDAIYTVAALGIMNGADGNFEPDAKLTRAEALAMIFRAAGLENEANSYVEIIRKQRLETPEKYNNICSWADGYMRLAVDFKIISIDDYMASMDADYSKASFRKEEPATKGEVALWMVNVFGLEIAKKENYVTEFADVPPQPEYARLHYETAIKNGILKGDGVNLGVSKHVTREEAAQMFYNSINLFKDKLGIEVYSESVMSNELTTSNEPEKIHNKRVVTLENHTLTATRTFDLKGEAVDLSYNPENEYKDIVVVKQKTLPQGLEALNQGDSVNVYKKNGQVILVTCFAHKEETIKRNDADYKDSTTYSGTLYFVDEEDRIVVIKDAKGQLVEIPYFDDAVFCNRENILSVEERNEKWADKEVYVFTIIKNTGTVARAYRIQLVNNERK